MNTRQADENAHKIDIQRVKGELELSELKAAHEREKIKTDYDLKKESVADESQLQMLKLQTVVDIHEKGNFSSVYFNTTDEKEPIYGLIDKFISMTSVKK